MEGCQLFRAIDLAGSAAVRFEHSASVLLARTRVPGRRELSACMVEIEGERVLAASCIRQPSEGMIVSTATDRAVSARKMVFELVADQPSRDSAHDDDQRSGVGPTP